MRQKPRPRVLGAGSDLALDLMESALGGEVRLIRAQNASEARGSMARGVDLVLADLRFERSRMLRLLRATNARRGTTFVDIRGLQRRFGEPLAAEILRQLVLARLRESQEPRRRAASRSSA